MGLSFKKTRTAWYGYLTKGSSDMSIGAESPGYAECHFFSTPPLFGRKFRGIPLWV